MRSPRNNIEYHYMMASEVEMVDTLFELCDAEFASDKLIHKSFETAKSPKEWARYFLLNKVQTVAGREGYFCSTHLGYIVAYHIASIWFEQKEPA